MTKTAPTEKTTSGNVLIVEGGEVFLRAWYPVWGKSSVFGEKLTGN